jgi:hypothetical protein
VSSRAEVGRELKDVRLETSREREVDIRDEQDPHAEELSDTADGRAQGARAGRAR